MSFKPPKLRYAVDNGLSPLFSPKAVDVHINKIYKHHHENVSTLIEKTPMHSFNVERIIKATSVESSSALLHYHASQTFAHRFFFNCLRPRPSGRVNMPTDYMMKVFDVHFDGFANFKKEFNMHATAMIGNGYTWLVNTAGHLEVINTYNAQTPLDKKFSYPLLVLDLWEHAYVYDWDNNKADYVEAFWEVVNWNYVEQLMKGSHLMNQHVAIPDPDIIYYESFYQKDKETLRDYYRKKTEKIERSFPTPSDSHNN